jgi:hypothetical protein
MSLLRSRGVQLDFTIAYGWVGRRPNLSPVYRQLVDNFISALEEFEADRHETECLIWMSMVAIGHCRGNVLLSVRVNRLMDVLMKNYSYVRDWEKLQTTLRNFFWYEPLAKEWRLCWSEAMQRRLPQRG